MKELLCKSSPECSHNTNGRDLDKPCSIHVHYFKKQDRVMLQTEFGFDWYYAACDCGCPGFIKIPVNNF